MIAEVLDLMGDEEQMIRVLGQPAAMRLKHDGHLAHWQRESIAYQENRSRIEANFCNLCESVAKNRHINQQQRRTL
jgi:hypothetical protein